MTVLVLSLGRLAWRLSHRPPELPATMSGAEKAFAKSVHWALYGFMIVMPLTGWMFSSDPTKLRPFTWFGLFPVPLLPVPDKAAADLAHQSHTILGYAMAALVLLHIAAALRHHFLLRDRVLFRMIPGG